MGRLIDADVLRAAMYEEAFEKDSEEQRWDSGCWIRYRLFEKILKEQPTIEPERKTGKWIYEVQDRLVDETDDGRVYRKEKRWKCSECGYDKGFVLYKPRDKFCIECGADMRGEENE